MARPREFELDTALADAMDVFWAHGYEGTSLPQLLDGMSLSRGSLYKAFTDKKTLFMAVLEMYEKEAVFSAVELLSDTEITDGAVRIEMVLCKILDDVKSGDHRGCLLCTAAAESAANDTEISQVVHRLLEQMRGGFQIAVEQSLAFSNAKPGTKYNIANLLLTQYIGLRVLARSRAPIDVLENAIKSIKHVLIDPARNHAK